MEKKLTADKNKIKEMMALIISISVVIAIYIALRGFKLGSIFCVDYDKPIDDFIGSILENGTNRVGNVLSFCNFNLQNLIIYINCTVCQNVEMGINIYYIFSFYLIALSTYMYLRKIGGSYIASGMGAIMMMIIPYHIDRGEGQIITSSFFMVPIFCSIIYDYIYNERTDGNYYWIALCAAPFIDVRLSAMMLVVLLVLCIHRHSAECAKKLIPPMAVMLLLVVLIMALTGMLSAVDVKENIDIAKEEGLRILDLIVPIRYHVYGRLMNLRYDYDVAFSANGESGLNSMGIALSISFICGLAYMFFSPKKGGYVKYMSFINILVIMLCSIGGFGVLLEYFGIQVLYWNRLAIIIILHSAAMFVMGMDKLSDIVARKLQPIAGYVIVPIVGAFAAAELLLRYWML